MRRNRGHWWATVTAAVVVAALVLAACGDDEEGAAATTTTGEGGTAAATVAVSDHPELGEILVGPDGRTLYLFAADTGTTTACTGACAAAWPALAAPTPTAGEGVDAALLATADAQVPDQVVYNGHLLYFFGSDVAPGDINGVAIADWYALDPAGDRVEPG